MSERMTRSRSWNAAMDMLPPPPHAFHGYAGYAQQVGRSDLRLDSSSVGTNTFRNRRLVDHHGKVQVALSGTKPRALARPTAVALV